MLPKANRTDKGINAPPHHSPLISSESEFTFNYKLDSQFNFD